MNNKTILEHFKKTLSEIEEVKLNQPNKRLQEIEINAIVEGFNDYLIERGNKWKQEALLELNTNNLFHGVKKTINLLFLTKILKENIKTKI